MNRKGYRVKRSELCDNGVAFITNVSFRDVKRRLVKRADLGVYETLPCHLATVFLADLG